MTGPLSAPATSAPRYLIPARSRSPEARWATLGLMRAACLERRTADPVAYADQQTSLADWRASLCIAHGVEPASIGPLGHDHTPEHLRRQIADLLARADSPTEPPGVAEACFAAVARLRDVLARVEG